MEKTITRAELEAAISIPDKKEALERLQETMEAQADFDFAGELFETITKRTEEAAKREGENIDGWPFGLKALWLVKEAYILGTMHGTRCMMDANDIAIKELFK
jgi:hypothetical protein